MDKIPIDTINHYFPLTLKPISMETSSLIVVGSGIKFLSHLTTEAKCNIEQANKVLYLVNEPAMKVWIEKANTNAESLDFFYQQFHLRKDCYEGITKYILDHVKLNQHVCVVVYGHPTVFAQSALQAVLDAKKLGFYAKILPGISAEDCLFADLLIDPGSVGCQSFEATDFLIRKRKFDPSAHLILWQVDIIGVLHHSEKHDNQRGARVLVQYLQEYYPLTHEIILYEAAQYPSFECLTQKLLLKDLPSAKFSPITTLYIPPAHPAKYDLAIMKELGISVEGLR